jgi:hypothetical protein
MKAGKAIFSIMKNHRSRRAIASGYEVKNASDTGPKIGQVARWRNQSGKKVIQCQGVHPIICPYGKWLEFKQF